MKIVLTPLLLWSAVFLENSPTVSGARIGVIGAGASGLTTAYLLQQKGHEVTVLEKKDEVGGFARTERVQGKAYDMATMFVPGGGILGSGVEPTLQELINVSEETLSPAVGFYTLDGSDRHLDFIPEPLQGYPAEEIISQLLTGLVFSTQLAQCLGAPITCEACAICGTVNEPLTTWGESNGVPLYAKLIMYVFDGLGAGPTAFASTFQSTLSSFAVVDTVHVLRTLGVTAESLPDGTPPNIIDLLSDETTRWYFFENGYQTFWKSLVEKAEINVITSLAVQDMQFSNDAWTVTTNNENYKFDQVVVTTAPQDALTFLPDGPQKTLIATGVPRVPYNDVFIVRVKDIDRLETDIDSEVVAFWPTNHGLGSTELFLDTSSGVVKPFFFQKRHSRKIFVMATYTIGDTTSVDQAFDIVKNYTNDVLGLEIKDLLHQERYLFPSGPVDGKAWSDGWAELQGRDRLWFNGEAFMGSGVPPITAGTKRFIDATF